MNLLIQISKVFFVLLIFLYCLEAFTYNRKNDRKRRSALIRQRWIIFSIFIFGYLILFLNSQTINIIILFGTILVYEILTMILYHAFYPRASSLLVNNMLMLLTIGFIMIARLDIDEAWKQVLIAGAATVIAFVIPVIIRKLKVLAKLRVLYAVVGIAALLAVFALATISGGAKLSLSIGGISFQFSEIVKITLVFYIASSLYADHSRKRVFVTTLLAGIHVLILVASTDLGNALVFFVTYLVMVLAATKKPAYTLAGLGAGAGAAVASYFVFSHVKARVVAWLDPFSVYEKSGYQIVQSLFAIGAGGWLGMGLCQGKPYTIPVASKDFIFAAICEEFGCLFGIGLILICLSLFLLILNMSLRIRQPFYKLIALGLGTEYAFQVFLTIGGVTKLIPLTGITLPLVSYGGSSVMSTIIMLAIVQGLYVLREDEGEQRERERQERLRHGNADRK